MSNVAYIHPQPEHGSSRYVLCVEFEARDGRRWHAIGGGASRVEAISFARESAPSGQYWRAIRIDDLHGD